MCSDASGSGKNELVEVVRRTKVVGVSGVVDDKYIEEVCPPEWTTTTFLGGCQNPLKLDSLGVYQGNIVVYDFAHHYYRNIRRSKST